MPQSHSESKSSRPSEAPSTETSQTVIPPHVVKAILAGDYATACVILAALPRTPRTRHTLGFCLIRAGRVHEAVDVFRALCLKPGTTLIRAEADDVLKINYATAILLAGIPSGALEILQEVRCHDRPEEAHLRVAISSWVQALSFWRRLCWKMCGVDPPGTVVPISGNLGVMPIDLSKQLTLQIATNDAAGSGPPTPHVAA